MANNDTSRASGLSTHVVAEIRADLGRQGMSQRKLAEQMGVSPNWVSGRLSGDIATTLDDLTAIASALGRPVAFFLPQDVGEVIPFDPEVIRSHPLRSKPARHAPGDKRITSGYSARRPGDHRRADRPSRRPIIRPRRRHADRNPRKRARLTFHHGLSGSPISPGPRVGGV